MTNADASQLLGVRTPDGLGWIVERGGCSMTERKVHREQKDEDEAINPASGGRARRRQEGRAYALLLPIVFNGERVGVRGGGKL